MSLIFKIINYTWFSQETKKFLKRRDCRQLFQPLIANSTLFSFQNEKVSGGGRGGGGGGEKGWRCWRVRTEHPGARLTKPS